MIKTRPRHMTEAPHQAVARDSVDDSGIRSRSVFSEVLYKAHDDLCVQFERLVRRSRPDQRALASELFARLDRELRSRMAEEEELLIGPFELHAPAQAEQLRDEHDRLRELLDGLASQIDATGLDSVQLTSLVGALRAHAEQEALLLYPWVDRTLPLRCKMRILDGQQARALVGDE